MTKKSIKTKVIILTDEQVNYLKKNTERLHIILSKYHDCPMYTSMKKEGIKINDFQDITKKINTASKFSKTEIKAIGIICKSAITSLEKSTTVYKKKGSSHLPYLEKAELKLSMIKEILRKIK